MFARLLRTSFHACCFSYKVQPACHSRCIDKENMNYSDFIRLFKKPLLLLSPLTFSRYLYKYERDIEAELFMTFTKLLTAATNSQPIFHHWKTFNNKRAFLEISVCIRVVAWKFCCGSWILRLLLNVVSFFKDISTLTPVIHQFWGFELVNP